MKKIVQVVLMSSLLVGVYGCSAEPTAKADEISQAKSRTRPAGKPAVARIIIPSGTALRIVLIDSLNSDTSIAGDTFQASLAEPIVVDGVTVIERGARVSGRVVDSKESGRVKGRASIRLALTGIARNGRMIPITTNTFGATAASTQTRDAEVIGGGAGIGAVIGAIAGGKKGAGIGALAGGGGGTGVVLATKGKEIHYGPETRLNFTLTNSVEL